MRFEFESIEHSTITYNESTHTVNGFASSIASSFSDVVNVDFVYNPPYELKTSIPNSIISNQFTYHLLKPQSDMYHFNGFIIRNESNYPRMVMGTGFFYGDDDQYIRYSIAPFILAPGASAHALLKERVNYTGYDHQKFWEEDEYAYATKKILAQYKHHDHYNSREYSFEGLSLQVVTTPVFKRKCFCEDSYSLESDLGKVKESFSCGEGLLSTVGYGNHYEDYRVSLDAHLPVVLHSDEEVFKLPCITFGWTRDLSVSLGIDSSERSILVVSGGLKRSEAVKYLGFPCCTMDHFYDCDNTFCSSKDLLVLCIDDSSSVSVVGSNSMSYMTVDSGKGIPDVMYQNSIIVAIPLLNSKNEILDSMSVIGNDYNYVKKTHTKLVSRKELTREVREDETLFTAGDSSFSIDNNHWYFTFGGGLRSISAAERNWLGPTKKNTSKWINICNNSSHLKLVYIFVQSRSKAMYDAYFMHPIVVGPEVNLQVHMAEPGCNCGYLYYRVWAVAMPLLMPVGVEPVALNSKASTMRGVSSFIDDRLRRVSPYDDTCACNNEDYIPVFYDDCEVFSKWSSINDQNSSIYSGDFAAWGEASRYAVLPHTPKNDDFHNAFGFFVAPFDYGESLGQNYNKIIGNNKKFTNVTLRVHTSNIGKTNAFSLTEGGIGWNTGLGGDYLNRTKQGADSYMSIKLPIEHVVDPKTGNRSIFIVDDIEWDSSIESETL